MLWGPRSPQFPRDQTPNELVESEKRRSRDVVKTTLYYITQRGLKGPCQGDRWETARRTHYVVNLSNDETGRGAHVCGWLNCSSPGKIIETSPFGHASEGVVKGVFKWEFGRGKGTEDGDSRRRD
ncbi:hypothetical protein AVEN_163288-1 [Araneus ventricosus]|uniref:DUF4817 domain-containing protein n=1 Tax=Araneus ventricosus TaxID=182803 RepID=A0A4Y2LHV0_ARAVE|nr:hypothetical protein AVEN_163288-1 [Araneus ventricosus]